MRDEGSASPTGVEETRRTGRPRALVFAYAAEPERGSEPGAGWAVIRALAEFVDCTVLVGPEHTAGIAEWRRTRRDQRLTFLEVPEPAWGPRAKRHRTTWFLLYLRWLRSAAETGRRLHRDSPFDLVCHATYSTYWLPSPAAAYGVPSIWGPVGGAVRTPRPLWRFLGAGGLLDELLDWAAVLTMSALPATRRAWRRTSVLLVQNEETLRRLPPAVRERARILNHAMLLELPPAAEGAIDREAFVLYASSFESRKGPRLVLESLSRTPPEVRLVMVGDGRQRRDLESYAERLGVTGRVEFRGWLARRHVFELMDRAAAAMFTGLREEGGLTLAEAMFRGTPVVVLGNGGARTIAASATDPDRVVIVRPADPQSTILGLAHAMESFSARPRRKRGSLLDRNAALADVGAAVAAALGRGVR